MRLSEGRASCDYLVPEASDISAVDIHSDLNWHGSPFQLAGLEAPAPDCFKSRLVMILAPGSAAGTRRSRANQRHGCGERCRRFVGRDALRFYQQRDWIASASNGD